MSPCAAGAGGGASRSSKGSTIDTCAPPAIVHISITMVRGPSTSYALASRPIEGSNASSNTAVNDSHVMAVRNRVPRIIAGV